MRAVLRELVPWRDAVAGTLDRATFRVLGNEQLLEIARSQPQSKDALGRIKGMPRAILEAGLACAVLPPDKIARRIASRTEEQ